MKKKDYYITDYRELYKIGDTYQDKKKQMGIEFYNVIRVSRTCMIIEYNSIKYRIIASSEKIVNLKEWLSIFNKKTDGNRNNVGRKYSEEIIADEKTFIPIIKEMLNKTRIDFNSTCRREYLYELLNKIEGPI